jgi:UDP-N-acetylglucosamine kinase
MIFDECVKNEYNFILDGTFTNTDVIDRNICRLIEKSYTIHIFYIHTQPYLAWAFTLLRGSDDSRRIPIKEFIRYYHLAYKNIHLAEEKYTGKIHLHIAQKIRDKDDTIRLDDTIYDSESMGELKDIFDKKVKYYYNL